MISHYCAMPSCRELIPVTQLYCSEHASQARKDTYKTRKASEGKYFAFYKSKRWTRLAKRYKTAHPLCVMCLDAGVIRKADICDHIIPIRDDFSKRWDVTNLRGLCLTHHNEITAPETARRRVKNK